MYVRFLRVDMLDFKYILNLSFRLLFDTSSTYRFREILFPYSIFLISLFYVIYIVQFLNRKSYFRAPQYIYGMRTLT